MSEPAVTEAELQACVDGVLAPARAAAVEAWLAERPEEAARIAAYREQNALLRRQFDPVLDEPLPPQIGTRRRAWTRPLARYAAMLAWFALGLGAGWQLHSYQSTSPRAESAAWAKRAAVAHVVYSPEVRHPVEVGAAEEDHLVRWLSKRLGAPLKIPHLGALGYALVGGRLLPGERGPVAQFMYQDQKGQRLTLYVRINPDEKSETAFLYAQEQGVGVFYWLDRKLGYALSGAVERTELQRVASAIHEQLSN